MILALAVSLIAALVAIVVQDDVREKLGSSYYIISLAIIGCVLLLLSGYLWDRAVLLRVKALGEHARTAQVSQPGENIEVVEDDMGHDEIIGLARQIERMARSLQRVEASYRGIVEDQFDSICRYRPDGTLTFVNGAYLRFSGRKRSELLGQKFPHFPIGESVAWNGNPSVKTYEQEVSTPEGPAWFQWIVREITDADGRVVEYQAVAHDFTSRKLAEGALLRAKEAAEVANRAKGEFFAIVSHEIRNPIGGVIGFADILGETSLTQEQREFVDLIRESGDSLLVLINDILDFSKIEAGKIELENAPFSPRTCVRDVVAFFAPKAAANGLTIETEIATAVGETIVGDVYRLRQVLINLVGNAVKFTSSGSVKIQLDQACDDLASGKATLHFAISDTGAGIAPEQVERLFQPYMQGDASTTRRFGGTGLGLDICRRLTELMGGRISVESTLGQGSRFSFTVQVSTFVPAGSGR